MESLDLFSEMIILITFADIVVAAGRLIGRLCGAAGRLACASSLCTAILVRRYGGPPKCGVTDVRSDGIAWSAHGADCCGIGASVCYTRAEPERRGGSGPEPLYLLH